MTSPESPRLALTADHLDRQVLADHLVRTRWFAGKGRPFTVTAASAVQASLADPVVRMKGMVARILMADGPAELSAQGGNYDYDREAVDVAGPVTFSAADGYRMTTGHVAIDLKGQRVLGDGGVSGAIPAGTFAAQRLVADLNARTVALEGNARLVMTPGQLRMP